MRRINYSVAFSKDGACTNWAVSYFPRLRRDEIGQHHDPQQVVAIFGPGLDIGREITRVDIGDRDHHRGADEGEVPAIEERMPRRLRVSTARQGGPTTVAMEP